MCDVHCLIVLSRLDCRFYAFGKEQSGRVMIEQTQCICICSLLPFRTFQMPTCVPVSVPKTDISDLADCFLLRFVKFRCLIRIFKVGKSTPPFGSGVVSAALWRATPACANPCRVTQGLFSEGSEMATSRATHDVL